ncbi:MAG: FAD-binding protein [Actinomycetota bacterium]|nr:FAD-binding protein [Actinomycetota bacterium]
MTSRTRGIIVQTDYFRLAWRGGEATGGIKIPGKEITIYGVGMSGLVAAINLAHEGHRVIVHDSQEKYGGSRIYSPSTHVTPIDVEKTS